MIELCFGKPGVGKSTLLAARAHKNAVLRLGMTALPAPVCRVLRRIPGFRFYDFVFCTDPGILDTVLISSKNLGSWEPWPRSLILIDECGIQFNNRAWAKMTDLQKRFFAMHRHFKIDILACSQTVDVDVSIRHRALRLWQLSKLGPFTVLTPIKYKIGVDNETHTLAELYSVPEKIRAFFAFVFCRYKFLYRPRYYRYFNSFVDDMAGKYPKPGPC